ncbi:hypothetical protein [Salibaculum halophilum]|uniref:hypothetical protein n=1 Tax=Salibaculum halophilum TaxID=1914408 RepID=UPI00117BA499|nr:hypothetical protein [Salibaculum halophilum]
MTGFAFDAKAALERAQNRQTRPNLPNRPNRSASEGAGLGGLGRLGAVRASDPEVTPDDPARDLDFHAARIAALADPDGVARTPEAIAAVWDHAEAMAALRQAGGAFKV